MINESVANVLESMGVAQPHTGAAIQHGVVPGTNYPKPQFAMLKGYKQSEMHMKHGAKPSYGALLFHWNGSHFGGNSLKEAEKHNLLYTGAIKISSNKFWGKIICMMLDYLAANGGKRSGADYMNLTQIVEQESVDSATDRCWTFYSGGMGGGNLPEPTPESAMVYYIKYGLEMPNIDQELKAMVEQHPELAEDIALVWSLGLRFTGFEEIQVSHKEQDSVAKALSRLEEAGLVGDVEQDYSNQKPTFNVLSENVVDSDTFVAKVGAATGDSIMFTKTANKWGGLKMVSEDQRTEINTMPGIAEVRVDGKRVAEYESDDASYDKWADQVRLGIDRDGLAVNEAVSQAQQVIAG